ncbi:MAG: hypothetical protein ACXAC5_01900 [Promethearchaeota archaeon]|jgi:hypothetical protein
MQAKIGLLGIAIDAIAILVTAFCGMVIWNWFIPEIFTMAPRLSFGLAMGFALVISVFFSSGTQHKLEELWDDPGMSVLNALFTQIINGAVKPIVLLIYAWIVHALVF